MSFQLSISSGLDSRTQLKRRRKKKRTGKKISLQHIIHFLWHNTWNTTPPPQPPPPPKICCHVRHAGEMGCVHINAHINGTHKCPFCIQPINSVQIIDYYIVDSVGSFDLRAKKGKKSISKCICHRMQLICIKINVGVKVCHLGQMCYGSMGVLIYFCIIYICIYFILTILLCVFHCNVTLFYWLKFHFSMPLIVWI